MSPCEVCEEMGCVDCDNCRLGDPCYGCGHKDKDCEGQCSHHSQEKVDE